MWQVTGAIALLMILASILVTTTVNAINEKRYEITTKMFSEGPK